MLMLLESENALNKLGSLSLSLECESKIKSKEIPRKKEIDWQNEIERKRQRKVE